MIPNDCLPEFFGQLLEPAVRSPAWTGLSAQDLIAAWLSHPARFIGVDKPVWQFLRHGGRVAEEFVSEAVRMVRERYETGLIPQSREFTLPPRIVQQYKFWLEQQRRATITPQTFSQIGPLFGNTACVFRTETARQPFGTNLLMGSFRRRSKAARAKGLCTKAGRRSCFYRDRNSCSS